MKASDVRRELLLDHARIRTLMDVTKTIAERLCIAPTGPGDLGDCVARLAEAVRAHNHREETVLRDVILLADAWGEARAAIMTSEHLQEHARLDAALRGIPSNPRAIAAVGVVALIRLMREHMDREEAAFLGEDVLRDDVIVPNQADG